MALRKRSALITLLLFRVAGAQQVASRDLVGVKPEWPHYETKCDGLAGGSGGGSGGGSPHAENDATLEIVSLNGDAFARKDEIVVTASLTNSGKKDLWIPWQEHPFEFEPDDGSVAHFKEMVFYLTVVDVSKQEKQIYSLPVFSRLFSSMEEGSSQLQLKPGQTAQIRFATKLDCDTTGCWSDGVGALELRANWWIAEETIDRRKPCSPSSFSRVVDSGQSKGLTIKVEKLETRN